MYTLIIKSRRGSINLLYAPIWSGSIWSPRDRIRAIIGRSSEALINSADNIISVTIYRRPFPRRVFQIANKLFVPRYTRNGPLHFPLAKRLPDPFRRHYTELGRGWESRFTPFQTWSRFDLGANFRPAIPPRRTNRKAVKRKNSTRSLFASLYPVGHFIRKHDIHERKENRYLNSFALHILRNSYNNILSFSCGNKLYNISVKIFFR